MRTTSFCEGTNRRGGDGGAVDSFVVVESGIETYSLLLLFLVLSGLVLDGSGFKAGPERCADEGDLGGGAEEDDGEEVEFERLERSLLLLLLLLDVGLGLLSVLKDGLEFAVDWPAPGDVEPKMSRSAI